MKKLKRKRLSLRLDSRKSDEDTRLLERGRAIVLLLTNFNASNATQSVYSSTLRLVKPHKSMDHESAEMWGHRMTIGCHRAHRLNTSTLQRRAHTLEPARVAAVLSGTCTDWRDWSDSRVLIFVPPPDAEEEDQSECEEQPDDKTKHTAVIHASTSDTK